MSEKNTLLLISVGSPDARAARSIQINASIKPSSLLIFCLPAIPAAEVFRSRPIEFLSTSDQMTGEGNLPCRYHDRSQPDKGMTRSTATALTESVSNSSRHCCNKNKTIFINEAGLTFHLVYATKW